MIRTITCLAILAFASVASAGDWVFAPGDFTHNPYSGERVVQYAPRPPAYYRYYNDYAQSGYRFTDSTLRVGSSVDRTYFAETWGGGGLAFASAWMWRGFNEDFIYPNDIDRDFRDRRGGDRYDRRGGYGRDRFDRGRRGYGGSNGFYNRGFAGAGYYGDSGSVSFDKNGATIGWDTYGGGWASGFENGFNRAPRREPRRDDRVPPRR